MINRPQVQRTGVKSEKNAQAKRLDKLKVSFFRNYLKFRPKNFIEKMHFLLAQKKG